MLLFDERRRRLKAGLSLLTLTGVLAASLALLHGAATGSGGEAPQVYALGNWAAPFGIVLVADRLSALMLVLSSTLGLGALLFSLERWDGAGPRFHALFLLLLMGVNGAVLTGDLFNLFVFFEVMLAASYGLVLHGSGQERVRAGLHYIAINLGASMLFLIGVSLIYGTAGTLNMADLAGRIPRLSVRTGMRRSGDCVPDQGERLAARLLATPHLFGCQCPCRGPVGHHEQGRGLCPGPAFATVVRPNRRSIDRVRWRLATGGRARDDRLRDHRRPGRS